MKTKVLEKDQVSKERRGVAMLEVMARQPDWWKTCQVVQEVRGLDWTEGNIGGGCEPGLELLGDVEEGY
jgi:hypothetical protein